MSERNRCMKDAMQYMIKADLDEEDAALYRAKIKPDIEAEVARHLPLAIAACFEAVYKFAPPHMGRDLVLCDISAEMTRTMTSHTADVWNDYHVKDYYASLGEE